MYINAIGKACPMPVVMAKKELDKGAEFLTVAVDNQIAVENLSRLAAARGMEVSVEEKEGAFEVKLCTSQEEGAVHAEAAASAAPAADKTQPSEASEPKDHAAYAPSFACTPYGCGYAVFIGKDVVGEGERELGENLMKMAIYTLSQSDQIPAAMLFMNSGVKLPAGEEQQVMDSLKELMDKGCEILVCGTCLNYYGLTEQLKIGTVSNMYDILEKMQQAAKVITL